MHQCLVSHICCQKRSIGLTSSTEMHLRNADAKNEDFLRLLWRPSDWSSVKLILLCPCKAKQKSHKEKLTSNYTF